MSDPGLRHFVVDYVTRHSGPEVASSVKCREFRNKCLFRLSLAILNDTVLDLMLDSNVTVTVTPSDFTVTYKRLFDQQMSVLEKHRKNPEITVACPKHRVVKECSGDDTAPDYSSLLRIHFWYFVVMGNNTYIRNPDHRQVALLWAQFISLMYVTGCSLMKEEAVTMMMGLAVCSSDFELKPPFSSEPNFPLRPLRFMKVKGYEESGHDPTSLIAQKFVNSMPDIDDGAFAFISVSKDLFEGDDDVGESDNK